MENKDNRLKYVEMPGKFSQMANDIEISSRQQLRKCEIFGNKLAKRRPKTSEEFENVERMKDFLISTHDLNTKTIHLITEIRTFVSDVMKDYKHIEEGAIARNKLEDASLAVLTSMQQGDYAVQIIYDLKKAQIGA